MTIQLTPAFLLIQNRLLKKDVSFRAFVVLTCLRDGPKKLGDLAKLCCYSGATAMTSLKDGLIKDGYAVKKEFADRRACLLEITQEGMDLTTIPVVVCYTEQEEALGITANAT